MDKVVSPSKPPPPRIYETGCNCEACNDIEIRKELFEGDEIASIKQSLELELEISWIRWFSEP